jgi:hypothetical protein
MIDDAKVFKTYHMTITNISIGIGFIYVISLIELFRFLFFLFKKKRKNLINIFRGILLHLKRLKFVFKSNIKML